MTNMVTKLWTDGKEVTIRVEREVFCCDEAARLLGYHDYLDVLNNGTDINFQWISVDSDK